MAITETEYARHVRLAWWGVVAPAIGTWACLILMLIFPQTPSIAFRVVWGALFVVACVSAVLVFLRGDRRSKIIASGGLALLLAFAGFILLIVLAVQAAFGS